MTELDLYALARSLVPDPNAAGDLFLSARNEAHLRRLAARWLKANGPGDFEPAPPRPLTETEQADALHLIPRRRMRRRFFLIAPLAAAVLALVALVFVARPFLFRDPLLRDAAFTGQPVAESELDGGGHLEIYRAEATPGAVTVWWALTGRTGDQVTMDLRAGSQSSGLPDSAATAGTRSHQVMGTSTFLVITAGRTAVDLIVHDKQQTALAQVVVPFERVADPGARRIALQQPVVSTQGTLGTITGLVLGRNYTLVEYQPGPGEPERTFQLLAGRQELPQYGWLPVTAEQATRTFVSGPVPAGATSVDLYYLTTAPSGRITWDLSGNAGAVSLFAMQRSGTEIKGTFPAPNGIRSMKDVVFQDRSGRQFPGQGRIISDDRSRFELSATNVPPDAEIVRIEGTMTGIEVRSPITVSL